MRRKAKAKNPRKHGGVPGLWLAKSPRTGREGWIIRYTPKTGRDGTKGRVTEMSLGHLPEVSRETAQYRAIFIRAQVKDGLNPRELKKANEFETKTFGQVVEEYIAANKRDWSDSNLRNIRHILYHHCAALLEVPIINVRKPKVIEVLAPLYSRDNRDVFKRTRAALERVIDYAKSDGLPIGENPARYKGGLQNRFPRRGRKEEMHYEAIPYENVPGFVQALRHSHQDVVASALEFLMLTAARSGEVLGMRWAEVDFDKKLWTIPGTRMKAGKTHIVPLSDRALEILNQQPKGRVYVFARPHGSSNGRLGPRTMLRIMRRMGEAKATVHGLRSSFSDWAGDMTDAADVTIDFCLAHVVKNATSAAYRRKTAIEKRRELLNMWATYCGSEELKIPVQNLLVNSPMALSDQG
jgi:integrase